MADKKIILLRDGVTWSLLEGASIVTLKSEEFDILSNGECDISDIHPISIEML